MNQEVLVKTELLHLLTPDLAHSYKVIPKGLAHGVLDLHIAEDVQMASVADDLELFLGAKVQLFPLAPALVERELFKHYRRDANLSAAKSFSLSNDSYLDELVGEARALKVSDIHFEIYREHARIRFRIDGHLVERYRIEKDNYLELVNKVKITSKLNITEKRLPQDGRITGADYDIRVSILPTMYGEKIVMRILAQDASGLSLGDLGMQPDELADFSEQIKKPSGIILISGPTGSGKTTTLYATLTALNDSRRNIVTVEDPIEYTLRGINQVQLKEDIGLGFAAALKSFLRQDPDVIMLGEIRDPETAMMAIRASLTGHLVLSTIHTNSAAGTIARLIDMGVPAYLISESLNLSVAQRLVRKLCPECKQEAAVDEADFPLGFNAPYPLARVMRPNGCKKCHFTGYQGRIAIYEILPIDRKYAALIKSNAFSQESLDSGFRLLPDKAFELLAQGQTALEEIYSILIQV